MIHILAPLCATVFGFAPVAQPTVSAADLNVAAAVAPDLQGQHQGRHRPRRNNPPPSGGTPEPASLLLLGGAVIGYGMLRRRHRKLAAADLA